MGFRADINGLRALAVLAVLAYHFGVPGLSGGFVGVDVFFVISGFLMTGIVVGRLERGTFTVAEFYLDRARRIVPALVVLTAVVLAGGMIWLMPQELLALGKQAVSAVLFLSNFYYRHETGYFAPGDKTEWLLHTWSLSTEWQFYMLYPLAVLALWKAGGRPPLVPCLAAAAALSFVVSVAITPRQPTTAFYLLGPRAWEMLAGGLVFLLPQVPSRLSRVAQIGGLGLVLASILTAKSAAWPGAWALAPVAGAALVIAAHRDGSRITGNPLAAWLGLNSYSIYLWHWPLALIITRSGLTGDWRAIAGGFAASLLLGHLSWRFIERRSPRGDSKPRVHTEPVAVRLRAYAPFVTAVLVIAAAGFGVWKARGLPQRFSPEVQALEQDTAPGGAYSKGCFSPARDKPPCIVGPRHDHAIAILIGDSHADADAEGLVAALPNSAAGGVAFSGSPACVPILGAISTDPENRCDAFLRHDLVPLIQPRAKPVVLIAHWGGAIDGRNIVFGSRKRPFSLEEYHRGLIQTSCALARAGPTFIMLPTPDFPFEVAHTLQARLTSDPHMPDISLPLADYRTHNAVVLAMLQEAARTCGVRLLDPIPYICPDGQRCLGSIHHRALFRDTHHLTGFGARFLTPMFRQVFSTPTTSAAPQKCLGPGPCVSSG